jgi:hypothetical protein
MSRLNRKTTRSPAISSRRSGSIADGLSVMPPDRNPH